MYNAIPHESFRFITQKIQKQNSNEFIFLFIEHNRIKNAYFQIN